MIPTQTKEVQCSIMDCILSEIEEAKKDSLLNCSIGTTERKISYGVSKSILDRHTEANPWLTRDMLNNYKRRKERLDRPLSTIIHGAGSNTTENLSDLTNSASEHSLTTRMEERSCSTSIPNAKKSGRPKGSTKESKRSNFRNMQMALNRAATEAQSIKEEAIRNGQCRVQKGAYKKVIEEMEKAFHLESGSIKIDTVLG
jgi:hypothetical protein